MSFGTYIGAFKDGKYHGHENLTLPDGRVPRKVILKNMIYPNQFSIEVDAIYLLQD